MTRILIVNNSPRRRNTLAGLFRSRGYDVLSVKNGKEALRAAGENPPDIIVTDALMPVMDGFELCRKCKADDILAEIPFIFYSSVFVSRKDEMSAIDLGADRFIMEVAKPEILVRVAGEVLAERTSSPAKNQKGKHRNLDFLNRLEKKVKKLNAEVLSLKQTEDEFRFENAILNMQMETSIDGMLTVDENGMIISYNRRFREIWDIPSDVLNLNSDEKALESILDKLADPGQFLEKVKYLYAHREEKSFDEIILTDGRVLERYSAPMTGKNKKCLGRIWYFRDITGRKLVENSLKKSEALFSSMFNASSAGILLVIDRVPVKINRTFCRITGYSENELMGQSTRQLYFNDEEFDRVGRAYKAINSEGISIIETFFRRKDGSLMNTLVYLSSVNPDDEKAGYVAVCFDITDLKKTELALKESEEKYRTLVDNMQDAVYRCDLNGDIVFVSPSAARMLGCSSAESMIGLNMGGDFYCDPEEREKLLRALEKRGGVSNYEVTLKRADDGKPVIVSTNSQYYHDKDGNIIGIEGVLRDITARKLADEALKNSEALLGSIFEASSAGIALLVDRTLVKINRSLCRITGYSEGELLGRTTRQLYFNDDEYNQIVDTYKKMERDGLGMTEARLRGKDGSEINVLICLSPANTDDFRIGVIATVLDVTDLKQAEYALKESEEKYRSLVDNMQDAVYRCDLNGDVIFTTPSAARLLGYGSVEELIGKNITRDFYYYPEDREKLIRILREKGKITNYEVTLRRKDNEPVIISANSQFYRDREGNIIGVEGVYSDITERKSADEKIKQLAKLHQTILEAIIVGLIYIKERRTQWTNNAWAHMFGYENSEIIGKETHIYYKNEVEYEKVGKEGYSTLAMGGVYSTELMGKRKDGSTFMCLLAGKAINPENVSEGSIWMAQDITEQKRAEEALRYSETQQSSAMKLAKLAYWEYDIDSGKMTLNDHFYSIFHTSAARVGDYTIPIDRYIEMFVYPDDRDKVRANVGRSVGGADPLAGDRFEYRIVYADGAMGYISLIQVELKDENNRPGKIYGVIQDITERKQAEATLKTERFKLDAVTNNIGSGLAVISRDYRTVWANKILIKMYGDVEGKLCYAAYNQRDAVCPDCGVRKVFEEGEEIVIHEQKGKDAQGETIWSEIISTPIRDDEGNIVNALELVVPITERKRAEEKLVQSLVERETLIRELYHRTKNTMQVVRGMLVLQIKEYPDNEELKKVIKTTEDRIQAISLVHQMLYKSKDLSYISIREYILELSSLILQSFGISSNRISLDVKTEDQYFLLDTAIPFGLILNELITNSLKYAFPDNRKGVISIALAREASGRNILDYSDNGVGVPIGFDFRMQNTLGLQLVFSIGEKQMRGNLIMENNNGVSCHFEFSDQLYQSRV